MEPTSTDQPTVSETDTDDTASKTMKVIVEHSEGSTSATINTGRRLANNMHFFRKRDNVVTADIGFNRPIPAFPLDLATKLYEIEGVTDDSSMGIAIYEYEFHIRWARTFDGDPIIEQALDILAEVFGLERDQLEITYEESRYGRNKDIVPERKSWWRRLFS